jgi:hypothetical protein
MEFLEADLNIDVYTHMVVLRTDVVAEMKLSVSNTDFICVVKLVGHLMRMRHKCQSSVFSVVKNALIASQDGGLPPLASPIAMMSSVPARR